MSCRKRPSLNYSSGFNIDVLLRGVVMNFTSDSIEMGLRDALAWKFSNRDRMRLESS